MFSPWIKIFYTRTGRFPTISTLKLDNEEFRDKWNSNSKVGISRPCILFLDYGNTMLPMLPWKERSNNFLKCLLTRRTVSLEILSCIFIITRCVTCRARRKFMKLSDYHLRNDWNEKVIYLCDVNIQLKFIKNSLKSTKTFK